MNLTEYVGPLPDQVGLYWRRMVGPVVVAARMESRSDQLMNQEAAELLPRIAGGDEAAFSRFYDITSPIMYGLVRRILGDPMMAEDVVSESYFQIWQQASRFDAERGSAMNWALTIARSRAIDALRRCREKVIDDAGSAQEKAGESVRDTLDIVAQVEQNSTVHAALLALSEKQRHMVSLAFFGGLSHSEIAEKIGIPLGTLKSTLREGMIVLRKKLAAPCWDQGRLS